ncbi:MAG TPA: L-lactate permease [Candidatus Limnocylindrales bacterium]|nr:L-lactate permease [Candidatus Limnocylindrales bacterium]
MNDQLPVDLFHWSVALLPIIVLLVLLVGLRWKAPQAGPVGMFLAAAIALVIFQAPFENLAVAGGKGVWDAIFILFVVWPALILYRVADGAGAFRSLRDGIAQFSRNELFLVLAFGWVFASFLQGIAGFGVPIAVVAPLLLGLGVKPIYAVAIPLIGHAWANMFGTLAVGWLATLQVVELENELMTAVETGILLWIPNLLSGFAIAWLYGRAPAVRHAWPLILIISAVHGGTQLGLMFWDPILSTFLASAVALALLYPLTKWQRYAEPAEGIDETPAMKEDREHVAEESEKKEKPIMGLPMALLPYVVLTVATVIALAIPPIEETLAEVEVGLPFPAVQTELGIEIEEEEPYSPFAPLTHPGTFLLLAAAVGWAVYHWRGFYAERTERTGEESNLWRSVVEDALPASVAIIAFLVMSTLMDHSGQTDVLALGIAAIAPVPIFAFLANFIGILGAFMTSSNTASNILFAPLQEQTVEALGGLRESTIIAAQSTGGAIGNAIAPANVVLGTGTAGIVGREGEVLRKTLPWAGVAAVLVGAATVVLNLMGGE